jgi:hypothetical protein
LNRSDPTGLYECDGNGCGEIARALNNIRDAASKFEDGSKEQKALDQVIKFYGKEGEKNGVPIHSSATGFATEVANGSKVTVTFNTSAMNEAFSGRTDGSNVKVEVAAVVAHEGVHGIDDRARNGAKETDADTLRTERNAYRTQSYVNEGKGVPSAYPGLWRPGISNEERTQAINKYAAESAAQDK